MSARLCRLHRPPAFWSRRDGLLEPELGVDMPRAENLTAAGIAKKIRMERHRARLNDQGRPESSEVDVALAAAAAACPVGETLECQPK